MQDGIIQIQGVIIIGRKGTYDEWLTDDGLLQIQGWARDGLTEEQIAVAMEQNRIELNSILPAYEQVSQIRIYHEEFEKTPKKSIKRFLYQKD